MVLKISFLITLVSASTILAVPTYSQVAKVSLDMENKSLEQVIDKIESQSDFYFIFNQKQIDINRIVSVQADNELITDILPELFKGTNVNYLVLDRKIILTTEPLESSLLAIASGSEIQQRQISGTVIDSKGNPMLGVTVSIKGTTQGTLTDAAGKFTINNVAQNATLVFSFIGMNTQEIPLNGTTKIDVTMTETSLILNEVIVVGYGTEKKSDLTGAVSQVNATVLQSRPIVNLGSGLEGTISNLQVSQSSYAPGSGAAFNIRGYTSINGGTPLVLVDGVVQDPNLVNPEDIESVTVLKDASSAAIYGARAAYGVILITTKKGMKDQRPTFKLSSSYSITQPTHVAEMADSKQYLDFTNYANQNTNGTNLFDQRMTNHILAYYNDPTHNSDVFYDPTIDLTGVYNYCANTNWAKVLHKNGSVKQINASITGGSAKTQYYVSYGYMYQTGLVAVYKDYYNRQNININVNSDIFDWLTISARTKYSYGFQDHPSQNTSMDNENWDISPLIPLKLPDGSWSGEGHFTNPFSVSLLGGYDHTKVSDLFTTGAITIHPLKDLNINADYTFNPYFQNHDKYVRSYYEKRADGTSALFPWTNPNYVLKDNTQRFYTALNIYADYSKSISKNNIKLLVGFNQETSKTDFFSAQRFQLINNDLPAINRATGTQNVNGSATLWAIQGAFFRLNYDYDGKYLLELNGRYDGSSKFPSGDRFAFFPSVSGGWVISKEAFWDNMRSHVSLLKVRSSYGSLGNQNVSGDFPYVSSYNIITAPTAAQAAANNASYIFAGATPVVLQAGALVSPSLTWEKVNQWDIGADLGFINNKLTVTFDYFNRATIGMLTAGQTLPAILGAAVPNENAANLKTYGWELNAGWKDNIGKFSYSISANLSDAQTEFTKFSNPTKLLSSPYVGEKLGEIWGYDSPGLFQSTAEITSWADQSQIYGGTWLPGDTKYADRNGDGKITRGTNTVSDPGDQHIIGNTTPRYLYGVTLNGAWKGIDASIFVQGVGKRDLWPNLDWADQDRFFGTNGYYGFAPSKYAMDYWTPDNKGAYLPNNYLSGWGSGGHGNREICGRYLQNAAYMRLKQVSLGFTLPEQLVKKAAISNLRIYFTMQNVLTFTKLTKLYDPEVTSDTGYPIPKSYDFGINITF
ncbi:MAG: TonB-dependent receptor [Bacteroidales bacterium]